MMRTQDNQRWRWIAPVLVIALMSALSGCDEDDCVSCVEPPPVAPTQVYSSSGDGQVTVFWNDYPEIYSDDILGYRIWSRIYEVGDHNDPTREFFLIAEVDAGQNYDPNTGQYYFVDAEVDNAVDYEYAVSAYSSTAESYLSFEFVVDTPLPMSETPISIYDVAGDSPALSGFDFSRAAEFGEYGQNGNQGVVDPTAPGTTADIRVRFDGGGVPWVETMRANVRIQDYGTFLDGNGQLAFEGVSWAPEYGYSEGGVLELIPGHIYVVEIYDEFGSQSLHYAKLGVVTVDSGPTGGSVRVMWAYQLVNGLPELSVPEPVSQDERGLDSIRL
jgi:hypothetical protein